MARKSQSENFKLNGRNAVLTNKDQYVPTGYIGMYSIFRNPKNIAVYTTEAVCQRMRQKTFNAILSLCKQYNTPNFAKLFNYNAQVIGEVGLNFFSEHDIIHPISSIIECFQATFRNNKWAVYISFGIKKERLLEYFETGVCPKIDLPDSRDSVIFGSKDIQFFANKVIKVDRSALYRKFEKWCNENRISENDAIMIALDLLMKKFKLNSFNGLEEYEPITILDRHLFHQAFRQEPEEKTIEFSGVISGQAEKIIERWNRDPDNIAKKKMDFETYCNNALALLNKSMPQKYVDGQLYYEDLKSKSSNGKKLE